MASICKEILSFRFFCSRWLRSRVRKRGRLRGENLYFLLALSLSSNAMQIVHLRKNKKPFSVGNACELCLKNVLRLDSFLTLSPVILPPSKRMKAARKSFLFKFPGRKRQFQKSASFEATKPSCLVSTFRPGAADPSPTCDFFL